MLQYIHVRNTMITQYFLQKAERIPNIQVPEDRGIEQEKSIHKEVLQGVFLRVNATFEARDGYY